MHTRLGQQRAAVWLLPALLSVFAAGGHASDERPDPIRFSIDRTKGADTRVNYRALPGPWDDRNYALTEKDLELLSPDERAVQDPIPAFYRVQLRRALPDLPRTGSAQYPRSALETFLGEHGGYRIDGRTYRNVRRIGADRFEFSASPPATKDASPKFLSGNERRVTWPDGAHESAVAINPVDPNLVIAGTNGPDNGQKMWRSTDGGLNWSGPIALPNTCCDPTVGWSPDGSVAYAGALSAQMGVAFFRSMDHGVTWTLAKAITQGGSDKEYLHVDRHAGSPHLGNIYLAWHDSHVQKFSRSTDGGTTWSATRTVDSGGLGVGADITSDRNGNVYFFYPTTGGSLPKKIRVVKSADGGATFEAGSSVASTKATFDFPIPAMETRRVLVYASADADRSNGPYANSIYVAWTETSTTENDAEPNANHAVVRVAFSRDGGATWTVTTPHSSADVASVDRFNQWLAVDGQGRVFVTFYDTRHSSNRTGVDLYFALSVDGAQTWLEPQRLTSTTSNNSAEASEWGDYNGMDAVMHNVMATYTDNRPELLWFDSRDVYAKGGFAPPNAAPVADFGFGTACYVASFTDASVDPDGAILSRTWEFGDGGTSSAANPTKTYAAPLTYPVRLTVTDNAGATSMVQKDVLIGVQPAPAIVSAPATDFDGAFSLSWSESGAPFYRVWRSSNGGSWAPISGDIFATSTQLSGQPAGNLTYGVQSCNSCFCSGSRESGMVVVGGPPATPALSTYWDGCYGRYLAVWSASEGATRYELYLGSSADPARAALVYQGTELSRVVDVPSTGYLWARACSSGACSTWSASQRLVRKSYCTD